MTYGLHPPKINMLLPKIVNVLRTILLFSLGISGLGTQMKHGVSNLIVFYCWDEKAGRLRMIWRGYLHVCIWKRIPHLLLFPGSCSRVLLSRDNKCEQIRITKECGLAWLWSHSALTTKGFICIFLRNETRKTKSAHKSGVIHIGFTKTTMKMKHGTTTMNNGVFRMLSKIRFIHFFMGILTTSNININNLLQHYIT